MERIRTAGVPFQKKLTIFLKHDSTVTFFNDRSGDDISKSSSSKYRGIIVRGTLRLIGKDGSPLNSTRAGFRRLSSNAERGTTSLNLSTSAPTGWISGDEIVVAPTAYDSKEAETFKINGLITNGRKKITGSTSNFMGKSRTCTWVGGKYECTYLPITQGNGFNYKHFGSSTFETHQVTKATNVTLYLDQRAEVANLTRNIKIQADDTLLSYGSQRAGEIGGHVMVEAGGQAFIDGVEFYKMGQAGVMGRYPFHWHNVGSASGQYIKNSSIHHSFQRCVTIHGTRDALVENNVCYDFKGHGFFLEDGNETGNTITKNLAIGADFPSSGKDLLASDNPKFSVPRRFPAVSSFWISNPSNTVIGNISAGSVGSGFWMAFQQSAPGVSSPLRTNTSTGAYAWNTAHSGLVGHTWDGAPTSTLLDPTNPNNESDKKIDSAHYSPSTIPVFTGLVAYKNTQAGVYFRGQTAVYEKAVVADSGWAFFLAYNQIVKNSVMIGQTASTGNYVAFDTYGPFAQFGKLAGITLYDGPFELENVDFVNYFTVSKGGVPFLTIGGTDKYTNRAKGLTFRSTREGIKPSATVADPYYRLYADRFEAGNISTAATGGWVEDHMASKIRDLDGTLMGTGANKLLMPDSAYGSDGTCTSDPTNLFGFKVCPETTKTFTLRFSSENSPNRLPFVVRRTNISNPADPAAYSLPYSEWEMLNRIKDLTVAGPIHNKEMMIVTPGANYMYEYLFMNQIKSATGASELIKNLRLTMNTETLGELSPLIKISGLGSNCSLTSATSLSSLDALKIANNDKSYYYSSGNDFYIRLKTTKYYDNVIRSDANSGLNTESITTNHSVSCSRAINNNIVGKIDSITSTGNVVGSACKYGDKNSPGNTFKVYRGAIGKTEITGLNLTFDTSSDDESIGFNCGDLSPSGSGHRFTFQIPTNIITNNPGEPLSFSSNGTDFVQFSGIPAKVPGHIYKGVVDTRNTTPAYKTSGQISGWACDANSDEQLTVSVTIGTFTRTTVANLDSNSGIATECRNSKGHSFNYQIPANIWTDTNKGKSVEVKIFSTTKILSNSLTIKP